MTLRLWGLDDGLPHPLSRPDEERLAGHAQTIFATVDVVMTLILQYRPV